jgi:hypothetical protein
MFRGCEKLETIGRIDAPLSDIASNMFLECYSLKHIDDISISPESDRFDLPPNDEYLDDHSRELL